MGKRICCGVSAISFLLGAALLVAGLVIVLNVFPNAVNSSVDDQKLLGKNSDGTYNDFTESWRAPKYISTMEYWVYNYTNTIGINNRASYPDLMEIGPYAYDEIITNDMLNFTEDGEQMTFRQIQTFVFNPTKSCKGCDPKKDKILVPDIGFQVGLDQIDTKLEALFKNPTAAQFCQYLLSQNNIPNPAEKCKDISKLIEGELGTVLNVFGVSPFTTVTVDQLLFTGYTTPFVDKFIETVLKIFFSYFGQKPPAIPNPPIALNTLNGTSGFLYSVLTGKSDRSKTGYIQSFSNVSDIVISSNGSTLPREWWPLSNVTYCPKQAEHALRLDGTNADYFKNFVSRSERLPIFVSDFCRTVDLVYDKDVVIDGINGYRFVLPADQFNYTLDENCGFCIPLTHGLYEYPEKHKCLPSGLLDISHCTGGPIVLSKPHFYQADDVVKNFVPRFKPNYESDETMIDIEPYTGTVLRAQKRVQVNMIVNQFKNIRALSVIRPGAYPLTWMNESFYMDYGTKNQLTTQLFTPMQTVTIICWVAVGLGGLFILFAAAFLFTTIFCFDKQDKKNS